MRAFFLFAAIIQVTFNSVKGQSRIPVTSSDKQAIYHYESGFTAADRGDLKEAENFYRKAIQNDTSFALPGKQRRLIDYAKQCRR